MTRGPDSDTRNWLEETCRDYQMNLTETPAALSYLYGRGLSPATIERFRLGVVGIPDFEKDLHPHHKVEGRVSIPTIKRVGPVGFKFKCIRPECMIDKSTRPWKESHADHAKYITYEPQALGNVLDLDNGLGYLAMTEGDFDTMIISGECNIPSIAVPSSSSWDSNPHWVRLLKGYRRVFFFEDPDDPGRKLAEKVQAKIPSLIRVEIPQLRVGEKMDVTSIYCAQGRSYVRGLVGLGG